MQVAQLLWDAERIWRTVSSTREPSHALASAAPEQRSTAFHAESANVDCAAAQLVLVFGARSALDDQRGLDDAMRSLRDRCPGAAIVCCSGGGQIAGVDVVDDGLVATAMSLDYGAIRAVATTHGVDEHSAIVGERLAALVPARGLRYVMVLSDGLRVNGGALVRGMTSRLPPGATVSGGLAADDAEFSATLVGLNGLPRPGRVVAIGFYGNQLVVGHGSLGGWEMFGPNRRVTRSAGNLVYELDGQPALALCKRNLGSFADERRANTLRFRLGLQMHEDAATGVVHTLLGVNESDDSMTFASEVPEGTVVRLMRTTREGLIAGAESAADAARVALGGLDPTFVLLVSCIGRRLVLKHRIDEELERARDIMGPTPVFAGFYSFGEIGTGGPGSAPHNQTMSVTAIAER
jgi:hypothetical protein